MRYVTAILLLAMLLASCGNEKIGLPTVPDTGLNNVGKELYVQLIPVWDAGMGISLNQPTDIMLGWDNLIYVCDTGNNRIMMLDILGNVQGESQTIINPIAITQDNLLNLFVVTGENKIYKIDLVSVAHNIDAAPVEVVHEYSQNTSIVYRGITSYFFDEKHKIYVAAVDADDPEYGDIIDFEYFPENATANQLIRRGPMPLFHEGQGLYVVKQPTCVKSQRYGRLDFLFGQVGENNFRVQGVTTLGSGTEASLGANTAYIDSDLYQVQRFINPADIDVDQDGFVFIVDRDSDAERPFNVYRFSTTGKLLQAFGGEELYGQGDNRMPLINPGGVAVTFGGEDPTVYVCDTGNNRILLFRLNTELN
jgi:hypothetical protein